MCPSHLKDRGFCTPIVDQAAADAKKKKELEDEIERVKKEYEEKQRKKKEKEEADKSNEKTEDKKKEDGSIDKKDNLKKPDTTTEAKVRFLRPRLLQFSERLIITLQIQEGDQNSTEEPRIFQLHRSAISNPASKFPPLPPCR